MATLKITRDDKIVFTFTGKLLLADFILNAESGSYEFTIEQDDSFQRGSFNIAHKGADTLNENLKGMLNYLTTRAAGSCAHRSELTFVGNQLAMELVEKGYFKMDDDHRYVPA